MGLVCKAGSMRQGESQKETGLEGVRRAGRRKVGQRNRGPALSRGQRRGQGSGGCQREQVGRGENGSDRERDGRKTEGGQQRKRQGRVCLRFEAGDGRERPKLGERVRGVDGAGVRLPGDEDLDTE